MTEPVFDCATLLKYSCFCDSSFCVLSDQATIIGISYSDRNKIIRQNISDHSVPKVLYTANIGRVNTLAVDEPNNLLFAGSDDYTKGQVVQYDLSTGRAMKNYGSLSIDKVVSSIRLGNLWFFGGFGFSKFTVIDSVTKRIVHGPVKTVIWTIYSMSACSIHSKERDPKTILFTIGIHSNNLDQRTDIFNITGLVKKFSLSSANLSRAISLLSKRPARNS